MTEQDPEVCYITRREAEGNMTGRGVLFCHISQGTGLYLFYYTKAYYRFTIYMEK